MGKAFKNPVLEQHFSISNYEVGKQRHEAYCAHACHFFLKELMLYLITSRCRARQEDDLCASMPLVDTVVWPHPNLGMAAKLFVPRTPVLSFAAGLLSLWVVLHATFDNSYRFLMCHFWDYFNLDFFFFFSRWGRSLSAAVGFMAWDAATGLVQKETNESPTELVSRLGGSSAAGVDRVEQ